MKRKSYNISYFICPECENSLPLPRFKGKKRERGHIKSLYCVYCNNVVKTTEIRNGDFYVSSDGKMIYV